MAPAPKTARKPFMAMPVVSPMGLMRRDTGEEANYYEQGELGKDHGKRWRQNEDILDRLDRAGRPMRKGSTVTIHDPFFPHDLFYKRTSTAQNNVIPSVATRNYMQHTDEFAAFLLFGLGRDDEGQQQGQRRHIYHIGLATLLEKAEFGDPLYRKKVSKARTRLTAVLRKLKELFPGFDALLLKEEETLDPINRTIYPHYHLVIAGTTSHEDVSEFLARLRAMWNARRHGKRVRKWAHLEQVLPTSKIRMAGYFAKPVQIPDGMSDKDLAWYVDASKRRNKFSKLGPFAEWSKELRDAGQRVYKIAGVYSLVERKKDRLEAEETEAENEWSGLLDAILDGPEETQNWRVEQWKASKEATGAETSQEPQEAPERPAEARTAREWNGVAFCGLTIPRPEPHGRKVPHLIMSNYVKDPAALTDDDKGELALLDDMSRQVREVYRKRCGGVLFGIEGSDITEAHMRAYLEPLTERIWARMTHPDRIYRDTITVSNRFRKLIIDIMWEAENGMSSPPVDRVPIGECPF